MYSCSLSHTYYAPWFEARNSDLHATSMCLLVVVSDSHVHSNDYDQVLYCTIQLHQTFPIDNHALTPSSRDSSYMYTLITQLASSRWVMDAHAKTLSPSWILWYHSLLILGCNDSTVESAYRESLRIYNSHKNDGTHRSLMETVFAMKNERLQDSTQDVNWANKLFSPSSLDFSSAMAQIKMP